MKIYSALIGLLLFYVSSCGQKTMDIESYNPKSTLVVPEHIIKRAKFPFIDVHNHQWSMPSQDLGSLLKDMDGLNMRVMVNLSGKGGDIFHDNYSGNEFNEGGEAHLAGRRLRRQSLTSSSRG